MRTKNLTFTNRNGLELSARLELPAEGGATHFALFAHCFTCGKDLAASRNISRALSAQGFGVLRFDFTGLGNSEGQFADSHFSANVEDLVDAAAFLEREYAAPEVLIGHSLGGAAVLFAATELPSVRGVVTIGAPSDPEHVLHLFEDALPELEKNGHGEVVLAGRPFSVRKDFLEHLRDRNLPDVLADLDKALLVFHSPQDNIVGIRHAAAIYQAAKHPKSFVSLDGADHLLAKAQDSNYVGRVIATWIQRYIEEEQETIETTGDVVVSLSEPGFTCKVKAGPHRLIGDEPKSVGGLNMGPGPYDFVSIGLAACTAMTIRMYTERKKWPVDEVHVHVKHRKEAAANQGDPPQDVFERSVEINGDVDPEQRKRIMEIADKCPVHRTLERASVIPTNEIAPSPTA